MEITRPLQDQPNLIIVSNLLPTKDHLFLKEWCLWNHNKNPESGDWPYDYPVPELEDDDDIKARLIFERLENMAQALFSIEYSFITFGDQWHSYGNPAVLEPGHKMKMHDDGPPNSVIGNTVRSAAFLYYISTDIDGGELFYPKLNKDFKPEENSAILHINDVEFTHGVNEVTRGWRIAYGFFGYEHYESSDIMPYDTERPRGT